MTTPDPQYQPPAYTPPAQSAPPAAAPSAPGYATPAAPGYAAPAAPGYAAPAAPVPGKGLAIAGLILAIVFPLIGMIISLVARSKLKKAGAPTTLATAGFWIGLALTVIGIIVSIIIGVTFANLFSICEQLGSGVWNVDGVTYTCG